MKRLLTAKTFRLISLLLLAHLMYGCSPTIMIEERDRGPIPGSVDVSGIPDAVPRVEARSKYGNPESYIVNGKRYHVMESGQGFVERGIASWYGEKFHGRRTSSGEIYDMYAMTAAHKSLPLPTYVQVTNIENGRSVILKVNDRGPFHENRIIDLSYSAAAKLDILGRGTGLVEVRSIDPVKYASRDMPVENRSYPFNTTVSHDQSGFYIQVGSFSRLVNAVNMRKKLGPIGENLLMISEALVDGNTVYRVRFGPINDVTSADRIVDSLKYYGVFDHYITLD